jgi:hypothetical protein
MSNQYPIWNQINSCIYAGKPNSKKGNKSYGVKQHSEVSIYVGTSARNSHKFLTHSVTHREHPNGDHEFRFYVNDELMTAAVLPKGGTKLMYGGNEIGLLQELPANC